ncbi:hypothetical protein [Sinimarinibacterium flocculans]|uniref:hypothetical protein n=1 Tax=Sinimarinibacterium flocculans TaxID=985250 RepID=UPI003513BCD2
MSDYSQWRTMREIDGAAGTAKGAAFRRFRRLEPQLRAGRDYCVLHHADDRETIDGLRSARRIHAGSVNVVLLAPKLASRLVAELRDPASAR